MKLNKNTIVLSIIITCLVCVSDLIGQSYLKSLKEGAIERVECRTAYSKTFINPDGTNTAVISIRQFHTNHDGTKWREENPPISYSFFTGIRHENNEYERYDFTGVPYLGLDYDYTARSYIRWSTSSIPNGSIINDASFVLDVMQNSTSYSDPITIKWYSMGNFNSTSDKAEMYNDIGEGTEYTPITNSYGNNITPITFECEDFTETVQDLLPDDYVAVGFKNANESNHDHMIIFYIEEGSSPGNLIIDYTPIVTQQLCCSPSFVEMSGNGGQEIIAVTNCGSGDAFNYSIVSNDSWLSLSQSSGTTPGSFTITAASNSGSARNGSVTVTAPGIQGSPVTIDISQESVPSILYIQNITLSGIEPPFEATDQIFAGNAVTNPPYGDAIITSMANVSFRAGNKVNIMPGFHVYNGADFHAYIDPFSTKGNRINSLQEDKTLKSESLFLQESDTEKYPEALISIYPNPNSGVFHISFMKHVEGSVHVEVINIIGAKVFDREINEGNSFKVDISKYQAGIYFIHLKVGDKQLITKKVVKQQ